MARKVHAAAVHAAPVFMDKAATLTKVVQLIKSAKTQDIKLLAFPETFVPGYPYFIECYPPMKQVAALAAYGEQSVVVRDDLHEVQAACREAEISICLGISERVPDGHTLFNSQVFIDAKGDIKGVHRKLQPTFVERMVWAQGGGLTLRTYDSLGDFKIGGLCCWENTMPLARQALTLEGEEIHVGAWPALNIMEGLGDPANAQIEALMKNHAMTGQTFVLCSSNYVDDSCLNWMKENLGEQDIVKAGGGWSAIIHPFCTFLAGPHEGAVEKLVSAELDLADLAQVKVFIDLSGHYRRPEVFDFRVKRKPLWADDMDCAVWPSSEVDQQMRHKTETVYDDEDTKI